MEGATTLEAAISEEVISSCGAYTRARAMAEQGILTC